MSVNGLVIGLDLSNASTQVTCSGDEKVWTFPTVIRRKKTKDGWIAGEEAYRFRMEEEPKVIGGLLERAKTKESVLAGDEKFTGRQLLQYFLKEILGQVKKEKGIIRVSQLIITLPSVDGSIMDSLLYCADFLEIPRNRVHVISHSESFLYYVLSQKKEVFSNQVGLFDLSQDGLFYYEMKMQRGLRQNVVLADCEKLDEGINLDILDTASGARLTDKLLCANGERLMARKLFSAMLLTGKGFEKTEWASDFMRFLCKRRKVYGEEALFAKGAAIRAEDCMKEESAFPYVMICEGRLKTTVSMEVLHHDKTTQLVIAASGDSWYEAKSTMEFILDGQNDLVLQLQQVDSKKKREVKIPLEGFPARPRRTTRIRMRAGFTDETTMVLVIQDKGFGELFPASDAIIRREIVI